MKITDNEIFDTIYTGFLAGGNVSNDRGMEVLSKRVEILRALHSISVEIDGKRQLVNTPAEVKIQLSDSEFDMLYRYVETAPWSVLAAPKVLATLRFLKDSKSGSK